jgi:hypothetical protein
MMSKASLTIPAEFVPDFRRRVYDKLSDCGDRVQQETLGYRSDDFDLDKVRDTVAEVEQLIQVLEQLGWEDAEAEADRAIVVGAAFLADLLREGLTWLGDDIGGIAGKMEENPSDAVAELAKIESKAAQARWLVAAREELGAEQRDEHDDPAKAATTAERSVLQLSAEQAEVAARRLAIDASHILEERGQEDDPAAILATYDDKLAPVVGIIRELRESSSTIEIDALGKVMFEYRGDMLESVGYSREEIERIREGDPMRLCDPADTIEEAVERAEKSMEWEAKEARIAGDICEEIRMRRREAAAAAGDPLAAEHLRAEARHRKAASEAVAA